SYLATSHQAEVVGKISHENNAFGVSQAEVHTPLEIHANYRTHLHVERNPGGSLTQNGLFAEAGGGFSSPVEARSRIGNPRKAASVRFADHSPIYYAAGRRTFCNSSNALVHAPRLIVSR